MGSISVRFLNSTAMICVQAQLEESNFFVWMLFVKQYFGIMMIDWEKGKGSRVSQVAVMGGGNSPLSGGGGRNQKFCLREFLYWIVGSWRGVILTIQTFFSVLKTAFCEYWTSSKIKISMTCVSKEYEIKTKMVHEQWPQLKMKFLLGYNLEIVI